MWWNSRRSYDSQLTGSIIHSANEKNMQAYYGLTWKELHGFLLMCLVNVTCAGVPVVAQWKQIQVVSMRMRIQSLPSFSGLGIRRCHELWCRSQTQLGSHIAVAVAQASRCSWDSTLSLGTSMCHGWGPKKRGLGGREFLFFFSFWLQLWHVEVSWARNWTCATVATCITAAATPDP